MTVNEYFEQGYEKQLLKQYNEAIEYYNKVLDLDKDFERAYIQRAYCETQLEKYELAINDFKLALELNPNDPLTYLNLSYIYYKSGNKVEISYLDKAIELDEKLHEAYFLRGTIHLGNDNNEQALDDFTKAIELEPDWKAYYLSRAIAYKKLNEYEKALEDFAKTKQITPDDKDIDLYIKDCKEGFKEFANQELKTSSL